MAEIKSTLDLVMERTRHLTLSESEKAAQSAADAERRVAGLVQRYVDQALKPHEFTAELGLLASENSNTRVLAVGALIDAVDLNGDNDALFSLLADHLDTPVYAIQTIVSGCRSAMQEQAAQQRAKLRDHLQKERHISGSAVVPHLAAEKGWHQHQRRIEQQFRQKLDALKPR